jgi:hypothetical protein
MSTVRSDFFNTLVNQTYEDIFFEESNYYFFLGKINPWNDEDEPELDTFPRTTEYDRRIRDNILYLDKIRPTNASIVTRRVTWKSGTIFDFWDHTVNMENKPFYCVTSDLGVYKCLYNGGGVPSTIEPGVRSTQPFRTSDGYLWKYMYSIAPIKAVKFLYDIHMPVQKALTDTFYNNGAIEEVSVLLGGSGYTTNQLTTIGISDTTTGTGAQGEIISVGPNGEITGVDIIPDAVDSGDLDSDSELIESDGIIESTGENYFAGARVTISSASGIGAVIEPIIVEGRITGFDIVEPGAGYQSTDGLNIVVGEAEIIPTVSQVDGSILDVRIADPGIGYESDPVLTVLPTTPGTGIYGNTSAVVKAQVFEGSIVNATIEDPGKDYPIDSETTITISGDGTGASFVPIVDPNTGKIIKVVVDSPGSGYTYAVLEVNGTGTGANIEALIAGSDISGFQSIIEQTSVEGAIYAVNVENPGEAYSSETTVTIEGDGEGAVAEAVTDGGEIKEIIMTEYGSGYSYANVIIDDPTRNGPGTNFVDAEAYAILPPIEGHGYDAVSELFGRTLAIYSVIRYDSLLDLIEQDYRQYGILQNPRTLSGNRKLTENSLLTDFELRFDNTNGIEVDEILINNDVRYRVVKIDRTSVRLQQLSSIYKIPSSVFFKQSDPSQTYSLVNVFSAPVVNKYSGNLLYTTNRGLFEPSDDLSFTVRSFLEFKTAS